MNKCPANSPEQKRNLALYKKYGIDLVQVDAHSGACEICQSYQGKVYSISGNDKDFPKLQERPPYHKGCRHIILGITKLNLESRGYYNEMVKLSNSSTKVKDFQHFEYILKNGG
ncbi:MAG: phage minor capsid protein [Candidatus Omnitrophota bacterium]|jgi:hypothetical protein